jgi:hypothetical protein
VVGTTARTVERAREGIREFFLLERAERKSQSLNTSQREHIRTYHAAARRRIDAALGLRGPIQTPAAFSLYQEASFFSALAYLVSRDGGFDPTSQTPADAFRELDAAIAADGLTAPHGFERARALLASSDPLALDRVTADEAGNRIEELERATRWLSHLLDPRSAPEIKAARVIRVLVGAAAALALFVALGMRIFSPKNYALNQPAVASSYMFSTAAAGAVDGSRMGQFGFCSQLEDSPWLAIDLGRAIAITQIKVFGRTDGYYDQSIPLALEASDDGATYREVASTTQSFSDYDPWVVKPAPPLVTRYVRLHTMRRSYLVLGEVEVYGNDVKSN